MSWITTKAETAMHMLWMQSIFQEKTWSPPTWGYVESGLTKSRATDIDMQILSLLWREYKQGKGLGQQIGSGIWGQ